MIDPEPWISRKRPGPRTKPLPLTAAQREAVEAAIRPATAEKRVVMRATARLALADGMSNRDVAEAMHVDLKTVTRWRKRFVKAADPVAALADAPRSGRPPTLSRKQMPRASKRTRASRPKTSASR